MRDRDWQYAAFLLQALQGVPCVGRLWLLHEAAPPVLPAGLQSADLAATPVPIGQLAHELDWVIDIDGTLPVAWLRHVRRLGTHIVALRRGHAHADLLEPAMFGRASRAHWHEPLAHELWACAESGPSCHATLRALVRAPLWVMPRLWSPLFVRRRAHSLLGAGHVLGFRGARDEAAPGWSLLVAEPNDSVVGSAFVPMLACEAAYRGDARAVRRMMVLNAFDMKEHPTFHHFAANFDLTRDARASYEPRIPAVDALAMHGLDCVVGHQWEQELRDDWCEVLWAGYPLVHNSESMHARGAGLYYPRFRASKAAAVLRSAWTEPPEFWEAYRQRARDWLDTLAPDAAGVREALALRLAGGAAQRCG